MMKPALILLLLLVPTVRACLGAVPTLWYRQPASDRQHLQEALLLGNGRLGCLLSGGIASERIQFNENTLWSGDNNWDGEYDTGDHGFGAYRNFGEVRILWDLKAAAVDAAGAAPAGGGTPLPADYRRELDLATGIHRTTFTQGGVKFSREAFASHPDQVLVFRYTASRPGALSGRIRLTSAQQARTQANGQGLQFAGEMPNRLRHACAVRVRHTGGSVAVEGEEFTFRDCDDVTLLLDARTNYQPDYRAGWRGADPLPRVEEEIAAAGVKGYDTLRRLHLADLTSLLGRVSLELGTTALEALALPTDARLKRYAGDRRIPSWRP